MDEPRKSLDFSGIPMQDAEVNKSGSISEASTHPDIQEILRKRREMLNRVRADLDKIGKLQQDFWIEEEKRQSDRKSQP